MTSLLGSSFPHSITKVQLCDIRIDVLKRHALLIGTSETSTESISEVSNLHVTSGILNNTYAGLQEAQSPAFWMVAKNCATDEIPPAA